MTLEFILPVQKSVPTIKGIKVNFQDLFKALAKVGAGSTIEVNSLATSNAAIEALSPSQLTSHTLEQIAELLIFRALGRALLALAAEVDEITNKQEQELEALIEKIDLSFQDEELAIDASFFDHPQELPVVERLQTAFIQWLVLTGLQEVEANEIARRLPAYFTLGLHKEWGDRASEYEILRQRLDTPFTRATEREQAWRRYNAELQKQLAEPMFDEAFSLRRVYIQPRAFYQLEEEGQEEEFTYRSRSRQQKRVVVQLEEELMGWFDRGDKDDAIRVISGGPGSGKSSFTKVFAAELARRGERVLWIPLRRFDLKADLVNAVDNFVRYMRFFQHRVLDPEQGEVRLLIIFDGLDELSMQGKLAEETVREFIGEVERKVNQFNYQRLHLQVLLSGREVTVQAVQGSFRRPKQVLHILPYFLPEEEREEYEDEQNLLSADQRQEWWQRYGQASGHGYTQLPSAFKRKDLEEITGQPLLNYLLALSYVRGQIDLAQESNLSAIYADLLNGVYQRKWEKGQQHPALRELEERNFDRSSFNRILEEIAVATWHGDGRCTTVEAVEKRCGSGRLKRLLKVFEQGAEAGITRLLTAFYFRQSGQTSQGDKTFEFTHKSFGEYLTAKRIVRQLQITQKQLESQQEDLDSGWDEREALASWIQLCGASPMDEYIFRFLLGELQLQETEVVQRWQKILGNLNGFMLRHGMPMERLEPRPNFKEECRQSRNAEEALLFSLNACIKIAEEMLETAWESSSTRSQNTPTTALVSSSSTYEQILDFLIGRPTPEQIVSFKVSEESQTRVQTLLHKNRSVGLTPAETTELDLYEQLDTLIGFLKIRAYTALDSAPQN